MKFSVELDSSLGTGSNVSEDSLVSSFQKARDTMTDYLNQERVELKNQLLSGIKLLKSVKMTMAEVDYTRFECSLIFTRFECSFIFTSFECSSLFTRFECSFIFTRFECSFLFTRFGCSFIVP